MMKDKLKPRQASRFAFLLKQKRKERKLSQEKLAAKLGYSRYLIAQWEKGESVPNIYNVEDICTYFAFPADIILGSRA
ncbi:helix-turn-helix domain-containing protein [Streptococcus pneumoniae]|uniref:helix-turn-helix domain-containing protein n=2 Tax=Streptococcus pneumoniae TaxID=1313 RepID=UPI001CD54FBF|nr:helix-turn-helix transcriptional regulator [Streptococcus pneumoniae]